MTELSPYRRLPTARQREVFDTIVSYIRVLGYPPTLREIGLALGIRSTNGVDEHLNAIERKGLIARITGKSRGITLTVAGRALAAGALPERRERETDPGSVDEGEA